MPLGWNMAGALRVIQPLEVKVREMDYHTMLGGSVLHTGQSENDLDIWLFPLNGYESEPGKMFELLHEHFGILPLSIRDSPDYQAGEPYHIREMWYIKLPDGRRIDFFVN